MSKVIDYTRLVKGEIIGSEVIGGREGCYTVYDITVESTINVILVDHKGDGIGMIVIDWTDGYGIGAFTFKDICELRRRIKRMGEDYLFPIRSGRNVKINAKQLEELLRQVQDRFFICNKP